MTDTRQGKGGLRIRAAFFAEAQNRQNEHSLVGFSVQWTYASKNISMIYELNSHVTDEFQSSNANVCKFVLCIAS